MLSYQHRQHLIDVFVWPEAERVDPRPSDSAGYHLLSWSDGRLRWWLASDLNATELAQFGALLREVGIDVGSFAETDILTPRSPYSASKASSDLIALSYVTTYGLPVVVTRCSNNFGPYQFPEKLIPLFTTNLLDGKKVPLYGDGGNVRDWIHVEDHNIAAHLVLQKGAVGEVYNIGAHNEITNREITYRLIELCGRDESFINPVADRLGHDRRYSVHIDKVTALGWKMGRSFEESLAETVEWNDDYTQLTVTPRSGVKWSDGEDFTADDIVFTFNQYLSGKLTDTGQKIDTVGGAAAIRSSTDR